MIHSLTCLVVCWIIPGFVYGDPQLDRGPILGVVDESKIYSVIEAFQGDARLSRLQIAPLNNREVDSTPTDIRFSNSRLHLPLRWRISHGIFWSTSEDIYQGLDSGRIRLSDLYLFDHSNPKREESTRQRFPDPLWSALEFSWQHLPARHLATRLTEKEIAETYGDFLPIGPKATLLFLLRNSRCQVWRGTYSYVRRIRGDQNSPNEWIGDWPDKPEEYIETPFNEPFTIYFHSKSYFFVTMSSKIHIATSVQKGNRIAQPFWDKSDQPIGRIITDTATNRTFAFTHPIKHKDGTQARPVYFELTEKLEPKEYDLAWVKDNKFESPMKEIRQAVDVLLQAGEIKLPKETPKK